MKQVVEISKEEIADFLQRVYANEKVKNYVQQCSSLDKAENLNDMFGDFLVNYAVSTADFSDQSISVLADEIGKTYLNAKTYISREDVFLKAVVPHMLDIVAAQLDIKNPHSVQDLALIASAVESQNKSNRFSTHSFNGALFDEVDKNGLDISKEKFVDELNLLARYGLATPFRKGELLVCELSYASFGYLHKNPERIYMTFKGLQKQGNDQTLREYLLEGLTQQLQELACDDQKKKELFDIGKKIVEYYTSSNDVCMAVLKNRNKTSNPTLFSLEFMLNNLSGIVFKIPLSIRKNLPQKEFASACREKNVEAVDRMLQEWVKAYPEISSTIEKAKEDAFVDALCSAALNNFSNAYADGHIVPNGRLERNDFALAKFEDAVKTYPTLHKEAPTKQI